MYKVEFECSHPNARIPLVFNFPFSREKMQLSPCASKYSYLVIQWSQIWGPYSCSKWWRNCCRPVISNTSSSQLTTYEWIANENSIAPWNMCWNKVARLIDALVTLRREALVLRPKSKVKLPSTIEFSSQTGVSLCNIANFVSILSLPHC